METKNVRDNLLTLENYCEKYLPINTIRVLKEILVPLFDDDYKFCRKLDKAAERYCQEMQSNILSDTGRASIFEQIIKINDQMTKRLKMRVDLQEALFTKNGEVIDEEEG